MALWLDVLEWVGVLFLAYLIAMRVREKLKVNDDKSTAKTVVKDVEWRDKNE